jgi:hypothetical protein
VEWSLVYFSSRQAREASLDGGCFRFSTTQTPETFVTLGERRRRAAITMRLGIGRLRGDPSEGRGGGPTREARYGGRRADRYALRCIRADGRERRRDAKQPKGDVENR